MPIIEQLVGREILDSRGIPTVEATCRLHSGACATASVPSGASVGAGEAVELRDGDSERYFGLGCRKAAANVSGPINLNTRGRRFDDQGDFDRVLLSLDGTADKSHLGANAVLAASMAFARAMAAELEVPLWQRFADLASNRAFALPRLTINLFSGGKHAGQQVALQDVLIVPMAAATIDESLSTAYEVYQAAAKLVRERYGMRLLRADEGGMAPPFSSEEEMIETAIEVIGNAGYQPGEDVALAVDVAATHFYSGNEYQLKKGTLSSQSMIEQVTQWVNKYPIISLEDGLAENDWVSWAKLRSAIQGRSLVLGDDLLCTNPAKIRRAVAEGMCNALLLKVNQVGTLTEALEAWETARCAGWSISLSVRSGETEDNWAADLAFGWGSDQFKGGSITQSERLAKYNRLLQIEHDMKVPLKQWPNLALSHEHQ